MANTAGTSEFRLLFEQQNAAFDAEYHRPHELTRKFAILREHFGPNGPRTVLDLGGGNGAFADQVLAEFPETIVTVLDVSSYLLGRNKPHPRKITLQASIEEARARSERYDLITANWLLHHLVGNSHRECRGNVDRALALMRTSLNKAGMIAVAENYFDGFILDDFPSRAVWSITAVRARWFVSLAGRFFNTAGVGVCFHSEKAWRRIFADAGLQLHHSWREPPWPVSATKRAAYALLLLKPYGKMHCFLTPQMGNSEKTW